MGMTLVLTAPVGRLEMPRPVLQKRPVHDIRRNQRL
jgi:hypothetical protein